MDFLKNQLNKNSQASNTANDQAAVGSNQGGGGLMNKMNNSMGGGQAGEKNEDFLDKGVDFMQEHVMGAGPQNNENAMEQAKDEQISDAIRRGYKSVAGKDIPIKDK